LNLWKDVPIGDNPPKLLNMIIEAISNSRDKYEYNPKCEVFVLDRIIPSAVIFPVEYGFVPQTWYEDGDPLDIMALSFEPLVVGTLARVRVIGALIMEDEKGIDPKILAVLENDRRFEGIKDIADIHNHKLVEIQEFFETYKRLELQKWAKTKGWKHEAEAMEMVLHSMRNYQELHKKQHSDLL
jgi:inorganic pyrophosphatase